MARADDPIVREVTPNYPAPRCGNRRTSTEQSTGIDERLLASDGPVDDQAPSVHRGRSGIGVHPRENQRSGICFGERTGPANHASVTQVIVAGDPDRSATAQQRDTTIGIESEAGGCLQRATIKSELIGYRRPWCNAQVRIARYAQDPGVDRGDTQIG